MLKTKIIKKEVEIVEYVICDKCKKEMKDDIELQECHQINFYGGWGSIFGDGAHIECDLCQDCLFEMIKDVYRITN